MLTQGCRIFFWDYLVWKWSEFWLGAHCPVIHKAGAAASMRSRSWPDWRDLTSAASSTESRSWLDWRHLSDVTILFQNRVYFGFKIGPFLRSSGCRCCDGILQGEWGVESTSVMWASSLLLPASVFSSQRPWVKYAVEYGRFAIFSRIQHGCQQHVVASSTSARRIWIQTELNCWI